MATYIHTYITLNFKRLRSEEFRGFIRVGQAAQRLRSEEFGDFIRSGYAVKTLRGRVATSET